MLQVAKDLLEAEAVEKVQERKKYMEEHCPPLCLPSSKEDLKVNLIPTFPLGMNDFVILLI